MKLPHLLLVSVLLFARSAAADTSDFKRVTFDEFFAGQVASIPLSLDIPAQYVHAQGLKIPFSYSYWMRSEEVAAAAKSQDLPKKTGYIYGKLTPNEGFDKKHGKFTSEDQVESQMAQAGMKLIEKKRFDANGFPVFSYLMQGKDGTIVGSAFVATMIDTNVLYFGYRPPNNDLKVAKKVWQRLLESLAAKRG
jgi:hypothetical protein